MATVKGLRSASRRSTRDKPSPGKLGCNRGGNGLRPSDQPPATDGQVAVHIHPDSHIWHEQRAGD